jgi:hypothetical protein
MGDMMIAYPNTRPMCSANCDGAAAAVVVSARSSRRSPRSSSAVPSRCRRRSSPATPTRRPARSSPTSTRSPGPRPAGLRAGRCRPSDLDLVELHDCFATAELVHYDNLMLCPEGGAVDFFESGAPWRDGIDPGERVGRPAEQGPPDRGHRHRQHLGDLPPPARRGRRPSDRGRQGGPGPRHRPRLGVWRAHPGEVGCHCPSAGPARQTRSPPWLRCCSVLGARSSSGPCCSLTAAPTP